MLRISIDHEEIAITSLSCPYYTLSQRWPSQPRISLYLHGFLAHRAPPHTHSISAAHPTCTSILSWFLKKKKSSKKASKRNHFETLNWRNVKTQTGLTDSLMTRILQCWYRLPCACKVIHAHDQVYTCIQFCGLRIPIDLEAVVDRDTASSYWQILFPDLIEHSPRSTVLGRVYSLVPRVQEGMRTKLNFYSACRHSTLTNR